MFIKKRNSKGNATLSPAKPLKTLPYSPTAAQLKKSKIISGTHVVWSSGFLEAALRNVSSPSQFSNACLIMWNHCLPSFQDHYMRVLWEQKTFESLCERGFQKDLWAPQCFLISARVLEEIDTKGHVLKSI